MANTIVLKRSAVPAKTPTTEDLALGEIAINTFDGVMYIKRDNGAESIVPVMKADMSNATPGSGILCGGGYLQRRELVSDSPAITIANSDGSTGNPSVLFNPGNVSLTTFAGGINSILPSQTSNSGKFLTTNGTSSSWATVSASASPGGSAGNVQYNVAGTSIGGSSAVNIQAEGNLTLSLQTSTVTVPTTTNITLLNRQKGIPALVTQDSYGNERELGQCLGSADIAWWNPPGNGTGVPGITGMIAPTAIITATARHVATTNIATRQKRLGYVSAATTSLCTGQYWTAAQYTVGNGSIGGFLMKYRFIISDTASVNPSASMFVGMSSSVAAPTAVNPSTLTNCIGIGHESGGSAFQIYYGGSIAQTPIALNGTNFPMSTISTDCYELTLFAPKNVANVVYYTIVRIGTAYSQSGTLTGVAGTALPASTTLLAPRAWRATNGTASAVGIDICHLYLEMFQY